MPDRTSNVERCADSSRREFLKTGTAVTAGTLATCGLAPGLYAASTNTLRVGLIGCGGRGTGAAAQALNADPEAKLTAMADAFADRLESSLNNLRKQSVGDRVAVDDDHKFVGFDAYKHVVDNCDVVLLATPPHFRPQHLRYAVEKGRHVFCEKPVAVDAPGVRSVLETTELAKEKGLSLVSGLCWRYHPEVTATFDQVHSGAIGDVVALQCSYNSQGVWEPRKSRDQVNTEMEYQMRNWYYYTWLSGDFNVEQHVHSLDKMSWTMGDEPPVKASGSGGRIQRTDPKYGNIYDHFDVVYEYANGVKAFARCRHFRGCATDVTDHLFGTDGTCHINGSRTAIQGKRDWRYSGSGGNMYQIEHDELFASIRSGQPINNGYYMSVSTMLAILGRMVCYTGKTLTWGEALHSKEERSPKAYTWQADPPILPDKRGVYPVAVPGVTPFV